MIDVDITEREESKTILDSGLENWVNDGGIG